MMNVKRLLTTLCALTLVPTVLAQTPSPAMIEQFKSLPKAQQQALAKQYGIDLSSLTGASAPSTSELAQPGEPLMQVTSALEAESVFVVPEPTEKVTKVGIKRFGLDLFDALKVNFTPTDDAQIPADYRLGIGDELVIQYFGKENQELTLQISREGVINLPKLGPINVSGLSFSDATDLIKQRVSEQLLGVEAFVAMGGLRSINVFMAGEVNVPGAYSMNALTTVTQAIFQAGGISDIGSLRNVKVKRQGKTIETFDVYDLLMRGDTSADIRLQSGDVVFVPTYERLVKVHGEVKRPMEYEVTSKESLYDVLKMAGGFTSSALDSKIVHIQKRAGGELANAINVDTRDKVALSKLLNDGDELRVFSKSDALNNVVTLDGAVIRKGAYGWQAGMYLSDIVSDLRRDLAKNADLQYGLIIREKNTALDIEVIQFSPIELISHPQSNKDPVLQARDRILFLEYVKKGDDAEETRTAREEELEPVLNRLRLQADEQTAVQIASISGAVNASGEYPISSNTTLQDLVNAAGGIRDSAYLRSVELRRIKEQADGEISLEYQNYDLVSQTRLDEVTIQSRDHVNVRTNKDWHPNDSIELTGEVRFPGTYMIEPGETMQHVIMRAGGLTPNAFAQGAVFTRKEIAEIEQTRAAEFADTIRRDFAASLLTEETVNTTYDEIARITQELQDFEGIGRLLIDLPRALSGDVNANIEIVDGDRLHIPKITNTVTVVGEVRKQGTHTYQADLTLDDYVFLGAGFTARADKGAIYIVKANGSVVIPEYNLSSFSSSDETLNPGDTIIVPVDAQHKESITLWRDITQIIYQSTVAIAAVARL